MTYSPGTGPSVYTTGWGGGPADPMIRTLDEVLAWLLRDGVQRDVLVDFTCPGVGPHDWTRDDLPNVRNQWCRRCGVKKPIPGRQGPVRTGW